MRRIDAPPPAGPGALAGLLVGVAVGAVSITLLYLGMRAVMAIGGACAEGGPYVPARPCPEGVPLAMIGGMFGLFAGGGLAAWGGARIGSRLALVPLLGWPALFLSLGWNFLEFGLTPPGDQEGWAWGWLIPAVLFFAMGGIPLLVAVGSAPRGWIRALLRPLTALIVGAALVGILVGGTLFDTIAR